MNFAASVTTSLTHHTLRSLTSSPDSTSHLLLPSSVFLFAAKLLKSFIYTHHAPSAPSRSFLSLLQSSFSPICMETLLKIINSLHDTRIFSLSSVQHLKTVSRSPILKHYFLLLYHTLQIFFLPLKTCSFSAWSLNVGVLHFLSLAIFTPLILSTG